jgi:hypothetical protein
VLRLNEESTSYIILKNIVGNLHTMPLTYYTYITYCNDMGKTVTGGTKMSAGKTMKVSEAIAITGTLSSPSKMPCHSYSIPAKRCITGSKLRNVAGSTCSSCYACKGNYQFSNVQDSLENRYQSLDHPLWVEAMTVLVRSTTKKVPFFRWHDSGDLQSVKHLANIVAVANATPNVKHWLPTREYKIVEDFMKAGGILPENLVVRMSAHMVNTKAPDYGLPTSTVHADSQAGPFKVLNSIPAGSHACPAPKQGNQCRDCRACWDSTVPNVSYHKH